MSPPPASSVARSPAPRKRAPTPKRSEKSANLEVVAPNRRWVQVLGPLALGSVFAVLLLMAIFHALIVQGQRELDRLGAEITTEQSENDRLLLDLALKETPQRIVAAARSFGMVDAPEVKYLSPADNVPYIADSELETPQP